MRSPSRKLALVLLLAVTGCDQRTTGGRRPEAIFGERGLGPGQFSYPRAIAIAGDGSVFVVDKTARIQRFNADGKFELYWQMPEWQAGKPTGITVDRHERVLVADTHYSRVMIFDRDGKELARLGSQGQGPGQFLLPTCVAVDADDNLYVSEYGGNDRISRFSPQFEYLGSFGGPDAGPASLSRPQSLAFDAEGTLWVADAVHHRICRFTRTGQLLSTFGIPGRQPGQLQYPYGVKVCPDGTLIVCEFGNDRVQRFDRQGKLLEAWGGTGRQPGQFLYPWSVAIGKDNRLYMLDSGNDRVQVFRL